MHVYACTRLNPRVVYVIPYYKENWDTFGWADLHWQLEEEAAVVGSRAAAAAAAGAAGAALMKGPR